MPKQNPQQPLFYSNPVPLMIEKHAEAGLATNENYNFSKETNSVPITLPEFVEVAKVYPIVFSSNDAVEPVAVLGLDNNKNLFVNSDGLWVKDTYIPAYVRRYPFAFLTHEDKLILCVDEDSEIFTRKVKKKELPFFENGEQTKTTKYVLDFCVQFHKDQLGTQEFSKALKELNILKPQQVTATFKDAAKTPKTLSGFMIVDEEKLRGLGEAKLKELNQNGFLALIYFHLLSLSNFNKLTNLVR